MNARAFGALLLGVACALGVNVQAHNELTPPKPYTWPQNHKLTYKWHASATPPDWLKPIVNSAADDSNASRASRAPTFSYAAQGAVGVIVHGALMDGDCSSQTNSAIACAFSDTGNDFFRITMRPNKTVLDNGNGGTYVHEWCEHPDPHSGSCIYVRRALLHEFGHVLGLEHHASGLGMNDAKTTVMTSQTPNDGQPGGQAKVYGPCDTGTFQKTKYGVEPGTKISTCLDLATTLTLDAAKKTVAAGTPVSFSSILRTADKDYDKLTDKPLPKRKVQLQSRPGQAAAFAVVATMDNGAGTNATYDALVPVAETSEFRAVFAAPAGEGLKESTSAIVKVTVDPDLPPYVGGQGGSAGEAGAAGSAGEAGSSGESGAAGGQPGGAGGEGGSSAAGKAGAGAGGSGPGGAGGSGQGGESTAGTAGAPGAGSGGFSGGSPPAGAGGSGLGGAAGHSGASGGEPGADPGDLALPPASEEESGCGCRAAGTPRQGDAWIAALAALGLGGARRPRVRQPRGLGQTARKSR